VVKAVVAVMDVGSSFVMISATSITTQAEMGVRHGSGLNQEDLGVIGIYGSTLHPPSKPSKVGEAVPNQMFHVPAETWSKKLR
jgi:hypothetical protein